MTSQIGAVSVDDGEPALDAPVRSAVAIGNGPDGNCDRIEGADVYGWAWLPRDPTLRIRVEQWVDGVLAGATTADRFRADLEEQGIGDGKYGWTLRIALDPYKTRPQRVEIRLASGELLAGGAFDLVFDPSMLEAEAPNDLDAIGEFTDAIQPELPIPTPQGVLAEGALDALDGAVARGWAWRPEFPEQHVQVEQWVDGQFVAKVVANLSRPDLGAAGKGHGRYGWQMQLEFDRAGSEPRVFEFRISGGDLLANGRLELSRDDVVVPASENTALETTVHGVTSRAVGWYDGIKGGAFDGWAWNPAQPDATVIVQLWIDGVCTQQVAADGFRPDLRANGVGHGRYGWRLPIQRNFDRAEPLDIEIRIKDGDPVAGGVFQLKNDLLLDDPANAHLRSFVESVLGTSQKPRPRTRLPMPKAAIREKPREAGPFWAREYDDYRRVATYFAAVLASLGEVVELTCLEDIAVECDKRKHKGEACILFAFGPLRTVPIDAPCPVTPVFGWAFPSIPSGMWDGDRRSDWRYVLRTTGRAIALSEFARDAARAAMGPDFPIVAIPAPVADHVGRLPAADVRADKQIALGGVVLDSRDHVFDPADTVVPAPIWKSEECDPSGKTVLRVSGVLFTSALEISDGRENWRDLISAFTVAHGNNKNATLLVSLSEANAGWWHEIFTWLRLMPRFLCRVIFVRGELDDAARAGLVAASNWYVNVPKAAAFRVLMLEFMSAGRPVISVTHTAMADYVAPTNAILVDSDEEPWTWPNPAEKEGWSWTQHPADVGVTSRYRLSWTSLRDAYVEAYRESATAPEQYAKRANAAADTIRTFCGDQTVLERLEGFLGPRSPSQQAAGGPSPLLREPPE